MVHPTTPPCPDHCAVPLPPAAVRLTARRSPHRAREAAMVRRTLTRCRSDLRISNRHTGIEGAAMSKQAMPPPPGDKPTPGKPPPPPPRWRHWLWPIAIILVIAGWFILPGLHSAQQTTLTYTQFQADVSAHKVKTVTLASSLGGTATGTLTSGTSYTTVVPV